MIDSRVEDRAAFEAYLNNSSLMTGGRIAANWLADGRFWFVEGAPDAAAINVFDPKTRKVSLLFDVAKTRAALHRILGHEPSCVGLSFDSFREAAANEFIFTFENAEYRLDTSTYVLSAEPKPNRTDEYHLGYSRKARQTPRTFVRPWYFQDTPHPVSEMLSPDGRCFAGLQNFNVSLRYTADGRSETLTTDGEAQYGWDIESLRLEESLGGSLVNRTKDPWSPDGFRLFATKFDNREVGTFTRVHFLKRFDETEASAFTRAGDALATTEPYVIDILARKTVRIEVPIADRFLLFLGWRSDSRELYFVQFSRDMREATLYGADATTGIARALYSEQANTFIRSVFDVINGRPGCMLLSQGNGFLWESERDGWKHLYHYDMDGCLLNQVTAGYWPVIDVIAVDYAAGQVYFTAHHDQSRPYDVHLCRASLSGGSLERLTPSQGVHEIQMAPDCSYFVATFSRPDVPPQSEVRSSSGELLYSFAPMDITKLKALGWMPAEEFSVKAADGKTDLWGVIYKPRDFDPSVSYPILECIYGGPQIAVAAHHFLRPWGMGKSGALNVALPQLGYVVVMLDARGTPGRSKAFQDVAYKEWRRHVTDDHAAALKNLAAKRAWMDLGRVGIWGHSWGGYNTVACMFDHPELYRVGVSSSPGYDPYQGFLYECYFGGVPCAENKASYEDALLYTDASKLEGQLMILAGSSDTAVWYSAIMMTQALIEAGKDHEFVILPDQYHSYGSTHEAYYIKKLVGFFERHLKEQLVG